MKKIIILSLFLCISNSVTSQFLNFGIKGGVNYNVNGDLRALSEGELIDKISSDEEVGYHFGILTEIKLPLFLYLRPELVYTHTESSYKVDSDRSKLKMDKLDIPVLVGFRILKFGRAFLGPNFQYVMNTKLTAPETVDNISKITSDDFIVAGQVGLGLDFGKIGADIRWETGFSGSEADFLVGATGYDGRVQVETDPQQFILSFYYKFK
jgi:hypothetical protein